MGDSKKDIKKILTDTATHILTYHPAQGSIDAEKIQAKIVLNARGDGRDKIRLLFCQRNVK